MQAGREIMSGGCRVRLHFGAKPDPSIRREIARMLLSNFEAERKGNDETSHVSV